MNKEQMLEHLGTRIVIVTFTKADGSTRDMRCTLRADMLPPQQPLKEGAARRTQPADQIAAYDLDKRGWRSFKVDSVKQFLLA